MAVCPAHPRGEPWEQRQVHHHGVLFLCLPPRPELVCREPRGHVALVTWLEVEVSDGVIPAGILWELGESERLVCLGHGAEKPARVGGRLEAGCKPCVPPVEGETLGLLGSMVELHDVHRLQAEGTAGEGQEAGRGHGRQSCHPQNSAREGCPRCCGMGILGLMTPRGEAALRGPTSSFRIGSCPVPHDRHWLPPWTPRMTGENLASRDRLGTTLISSPEEGSTLQSFDRPSLTLPTLCPG